MFNIGNFRHVIAVILLLKFTLVYAQDITYRGLGLNRDGYHTELLQLIFQHAGVGDYQVKRYGLEIPHQRSFQFLANNELVDIVIGYATDERISKYQAIEIPIMKGLNGWRVGLIHQDNITLFKDVKTLSALQQFSPGLFHTWTDNKIFSTNNINVTKGTEFIGLFRMLNKKRFDYLPLSILEVSREAVTFQQGYQFDIVVEPYLIIRYPVCFYFYVNKNNKTLAKEIERGFETIIANGQFERLFQQHFGSILREFLNKNRRVIELTNPILPKSVPLHRKVLWLSDE